MTEQVRGSSYKPFAADDKKTTRTIMHEAVPITGTIVSGTYALATSGLSQGQGINIRNFSHGMFQSVYDYPYLSSSANHLFDITAGFSTGAAGNGGSVSGSATNQVSKKVNIYNQMAQVLAGFDVSGSVRRFDKDGDYATAAGKINNAVFINFSRLLVKDEIKKGSMSLTLGTNAAYATPFGSTITVTDADSAENYRVNSPAGEYGFLKNGATTVGLVFYQAGIIAMTSSVFGINSQIMNNASSSHDDVLKKDTINNFANGVRHRIKNISFNNTTEINSSIYFCRLHNNEFNYSTNPTYLSGSKLVVKKIPGSSSEKDEMPFSYITTVGLYSEINELLAVAKLSEPVKKTPENELTLRVRLDF